MIQKYSESKIPLSHGDFIVSVYKDTEAFQEHLAIYRELDPSEPVFVRIHSECLTGEVLGSLKCDCKDQLDLALDHIGQDGNGIVIYLRQEGRGIGLGNKIKAYELQNQGLDTVEANLRLGFKVDQRSFGTATDILADLGVKSIRLNTNNPEKISAMRDAGVEVIEVVPSLGKVNPHNEKYLQTKAQRLGHFLL